MKKKLIQNYETLNPFQLRETIEAKSIEFGNFKELLK